MKLPNNIREKCIKSISKIAVAQAEMKDEVGVIKSMDTLMSLVPKPTTDLIAQMSSEELNTKIDHILGWLHPLIERLEEKHPKEKRDWWRKAKGK